MSELLPSPVLVGPHLPTVHVSRSSLFPLCLSGPLSVITHFSDLMTTVGSPSLVCCIRTSLDVPAGHLVTSRDNLNKLPHNITCYENSRSIANLSMTKQSYETRHQDLLTRFIKLAYIPGALLWALLPIHTAKISHTGHLDIGTSRRLCMCYYVAYFTLCV